MKDGQLFRLPHGGTSPELIVSGLGDVAKLSGDDATMYADVRPAGSSYADLLAIDLSAGSFETVRAHEFLYDILRWQGELYWTGVSHLYRLEAGGGATELLGADAASAYGNRLLGVGDEVVFWGGDALVAYHVTGGTLRTIYPSPGARDATVQGNSVLVGSVNQPGIVRVPFDSPLRTVETLNPAEFADRAAILSLDKDGSDLFWTSQDFNAGNLHRLWTSRSDGANPHILYESSSTGRLRDAVVENGRIFFLCLETCGSPGWAVASIPKDGGPVTLELPLRFGPQLVERQGLLYVLDAQQYGPGPMDVLVLDPSTGEGDILLSGIHAEDFSVEVSDEWFYLASGDLAGNSADDISRYPRLAWNRAGSRQRLVDTSTTPSVELNALSMHFDGSHLYFWDLGIKRIAD